MEKRLVIFDLDQTLVHIPDAYDYFDGLILQVTRHFKLPPPKQEERDKLWRIGKDYLALLSSWGFQDPHVFWPHFDLLDFAGRKQKLENEEMVLFDSVLPLLSQLRDEGYSLAILSNTIKKIVDYTLNFFEITTFFEKIIALGDNQVDCKPSPVGVHQIAQELNVPLANTVIVGDAISDIKAGNNAGIRSFLIRRRVPERFQMQLLNSELDFVLLRSLAELPDHL